MTDVKQAETKGRIQDVIQGHLCCLGHDLFDGSHAGAGLHGKHIAHNKKHQFSFRTHDGMKSAPRFVKALKGSEEAFNTVCGAGIRIRSQGWLQPVEFFLSVGDPGLKPTVLSALRRGEPG